MTMPRIPLSTYRLQFNHVFTFRDAARIVPYLHGVGITDCYASSFLKAVPGSLHGYDVIDPTVLNPELGSEEDFEAFTAALREHGMGLVLDVVPNHMGIAAADNRWWWDVLEQGPGARYAPFFDIDWHPLKRELEDKVLLPILGEQYGTVLENQDIRLVYENQGFVLTYYHHRLPVAATSWVGILSLGLSELAARLGEEHGAIQELRSILTALRNVPPRHERVPEVVAERYREQAIIRRRLASLMKDSSDVREQVMANVEAYNGMKGESASFDRLDGLLNQQSYRLASWRVASEEINYRRFFDVNELAAIRTELPAVFDESHRLVFRLLKAGVVTGLRIDHVDGLYDPEHYLRQLQVWAARNLSRDGQDAASLFIVVEKILGKGEQLPHTWSVAGTTGYDFLNMVNGLFVRSDQERAMEALYTRFAGPHLPFEELVYQCKKLIMRVSMSSELNVLGHQLNGLSERDRHYRDFTLNSLTHAIREIIACFPVYRTYVTADRDTLSDRDHAYIGMAVARAKRRNPALSSHVFDFVRDLLWGTLDHSAGMAREEQIRFVTKFQQTTGPVMAKGMEDTACYLYNRLVSLNEVGGESTRFGTSVEGFHKAVRERQAGWPHSMLTTSTHDTKRGEDVRARINVLSELPDRWRSATLRWAKLNKRHRTAIEGVPAPDRNDEYLLYQTLVGAWPLGPMEEAQHRSFQERIEAYMVKAVREAKVHSSWINPQEGYEQALRGFIRGILARKGPNQFLDDFLPLQAVVARYGMVNGLAQVLLRVAAPGVADCYQGTELWDLNLVDPDNRRPVDYDLRSRLAADLDREVRRADGGRLDLVHRLMAAWPDGRIKFYVLQEALRHRRAHAALYLDGDYVPLTGEGRAHAHLCAFARLHHDEAVVAIVPRLMATLTAEREQELADRHLWTDTWVTVPSWRERSRYRHLFTGEQFETVTQGERQALPVGPLLSPCPAALLMRES